MIIIVNFQIFLDLPGKKFYLQRMDKKVCLFGLYVAPLCPWVRKFSRHYENFSDENLSLGESILWKFYSSIEMEPSEYRPYSRQTFMINCPFYDLFSLSCQLNWVKCCDSIWYSWKRESWKKILSWEEQFDIFFVPQGCLPMHFLHLKVRIPIFLFYEQTQNTKSTSKLWVVTFSKEKHEFQVTKLKLFLETFFNSCTLSIHSGKRGFKIFKAQTKPKLL